MSTSHRVGFSPPCDSVWTGRTSKQRIMGNRSLGETDADRKNENGAEEGRGSFTSLLRLCVVRTIVTASAVGDHRCGAGRRVTRAGGEERARAFLLGTLRGLEKESCLIQEAPIIRSTGVVSRGLFSFFSHAWGGRVRCASHPQVAHVVCTDIAVDVR